MDDAGDVAEYRQQNVEPEVQTQADCEENAHGRQQDRQDAADNFRYTSPGRMCRSGYQPDQGD